MRLGVHKPNRDVFLCPCASLWITNQGCVKTCRGKASPRCCWMRDRYLACLLWWGCLHTYVNKWRHAESGLLVDLSFGLNIKAAVSALCQAKKIGVGVLNVWRNRTPEYRVVAFFGVYHRKYSTCCSIRDFRNLCWVRLSLNKTRRNGLRHL